MDHTVSAAEIIRDPAANAHMTKDEQIAFANSDANLNEMDSSLNRSKGDKSMTDWLDNPNSKQNDAIVASVQKNKEEVEAKIAASIQETNNTIESLTKKIKYAYWIAGGAAGLAIIELLLLLL